MILINLIVIASAIAYLAYRLNFKWWWIFGIVSFFSPILGILFLAIIDFYKTYARKLNER